MPRPNCRCRAEYIWSCGLCFRYREHWPLSLRFRAVYILQRVRNRLCT